MLARKTSCRKIRTRGSWGGSTLPRQEDSPEEGSEEENE